MGKLPYQFERVAMPQHGAEPRQYRFDLVNTQTGKVIAYGFSGTPFVPKRLARRQAELNTRHFFGEVGI